MKTDVRTIEEIRAILTKHKREVAEKYRVSEIGIFGSFVRGEQKKRSDIDIVVDFYKIPDLLTFTELERHLQGLPRKKVDLVDRKGIKPQLRETILRQVMYA